MRFTRFWLFCFTSKAIACNADQMRIAHKKGIQKRFRSWKKWLEITINIIAHAIIMFYKIILNFRLIKISRGRNFSIKNPKLLRKFTCCSSYTNPNSPCWLKIIFRACWSVFFSNQMMHIEKKMHKRADIWRHFALWQLKRV